MSYLGITIQILEYHPKNFNFENFSFIFSSESRDFEKEITFSAKNSISHKISLPRKNLKYSIKITRNNSLIGICDFIIPFQVFTKREGFFNKYCQMTMTDSIRRLIFGNIPPNNIKININANFQYLEKGEKLNKSSASNNIIKKEEKEKDKSKRASTPKKYENKFNKNKYGNLTTILKLNKDEKIGMHKKMTEDFKKRSNSKPQMNNVTDKAALNLKIKNYQKGLKEQKKEKAKEKNIENNNKNNIIKKAEKNINENIEENSDIDEDLKNNLPKNENNIIDFMKSFEKEHPLEKLEEFKEPYELMLYTKSIINELLDYQLNFYSYLKNSVNANKKFRDLLLNYNAKYRLSLKKMSKAEEELRTNEIKEDLLSSNQNIKNINEKNLLPLKQEEIDIYKELYIINADKKNKEEEKLTEEQLKQIEEKKAKDANTQLLLIKILKNIYNKYGPLNGIINKTNSEESEIQNILSLSEKYNLPIGNVNLEYQYVISSTPDEIDNQLELCVKNYFKTKNGQKIIFKKTGNNLYECGNIKVSIIIENNEINVKTPEGIISLDKFIEKIGGIDDENIKGNKKPKKS